MPEQKYKVRLNKAAELVLFEKFPKDSDRKGKTKYASDAIIEKDLREKKC